MWTLPLRALFILINESCTLKSCPQALWSVLCNISCSHIVIHVVPCRLLVLLIGSSRLFSIYLPGFLFQPHSVGDGSCEAVVIILVQTMTSQAAVLVCWMSANCYRMQTMNSSAFLAQQLFPCLVCTFLCVGSIVQQDYKIDPVDASTCQ